ncbi:hypothetical protein [Streptomyces sp. NPDC005485]|uniref:hypothetical protein n=1 Tax=Streptomyces sp. NPDC005485 TaxID=3155591 RepID=UPI0033A11189
MPTKKRTARPVPAAKQCTTCLGSGEVSIPVKVGRKRRITENQQTGLCLTCLGSGEAPTD